MPNPCPPPSPPRTVCMRRGDGGVVQAEDRVVGKVALRNGRDTRALRLAPRSSEATACVDSADCTSKSMAFAMRLRAALHTLVAPLPS
eukprot:6208524-Pleurochrysis_carterae.AAC.1